MSLHPRFRLQNPPPRGTLPTLRTRHHKSRNIPLSSSTVIRLLQSRLKMKLLFLHKRQCLSTTALQRRHQMANFINSQASDTGQSIKVLINHTSTNLSEQQSSYLWRSHPTQQQARTETTLCRTCSISSRPRLYVSNLTVRICSIASV